MHVVLAGVVAGWTTLATGFGYAQPGPPRTAWGTPDLRGVWSHASAAPLERPSQHGDRERLTEEEIAQVNAAAQSTEGVGARRVVWWERPLSDGRTSLVVDPPNGRIPYTEEARQRRRDMPPPGVDDPEDRPLQERCITYGIPRLGGPYSQNIHVVQTPDHVMLLFEMIHEFRIIPLDDRPHLPPTVRQWLGDSRGHWEDDTLVVETTNFNRHQRHRGLPLTTTRLIERFTPTDTETLLYEVTFEDSATWSQPWTTSLPMARADGPMFEFACHEGNVGLTAVLEIARTTTE
ncbi:MAG: hypothetical protein VYE68_07185 [Acidobacteriota bacterium]|nr:hypothetical protein [Acidobacteriota bacterium]